MLGPKLNVLILMLVGWDMVGIIRLVRGCLVTKKYQMSGEEFVRQFYEKERILRTTRDYFDWPLYDYWWENRKLDEIKLLQSDEPWVKDVNASLRDVKFTEEPISFTKPISSDDRILADSVLIPIPVLSCRDLFHEFKDTANYSLRFSNVNSSDFHLVKANMFVLVISGEWLVFGRNGCKTHFRSGELIYIPRGLEVAASKTYGRFLGVQIAWGYEKQKSASEQIACRPVTLQSAGFRRGWSRNTSMDAQIGSVLLNTGFSIPPVGLGTALLGPSTYETVSRALRIGYRLIETSKAYYAKEDVLVESEIGRAIADAKITRAEIFVSIRIPLSTADRSVSSILSESLKNTKLSYIDLILLELPEEHDFLDDSFARFVWSAWSELEKMRNMGKIRSLGMSNILDSKELEIITSQVRESLSVVQNWFDLLRPDEEIRDLCSKHKIIFMGYGVLGFQRKQVEKAGINRILESPLVTQFAKENDVPRATVLLRWAMTKGVVVTPSSVDEYHLETNFYSTQINMKELTFGKAEMEGDVSTNSSESRTGDGSVKEEL